MSQERSHDERCVLVVDDEEGIRETLSEVVEMAGCSALAAATGAEALEILAKRQPCLIILDLLMPVMDGRQFLEAMKKTPALAALPVVVSTSAPGLAPPGMPVIRKPIDIHAVWEWMRRSCSCSIDPAADLRETPR